MDFFRVEIEKAQVTLAANNTWKKLICKTLPQQTKLICKMVLHSKLPRTVTASIAREPLIVDSPGILEP
jgi:hypothetical protein